MLQRPRIFELTVTKEYPIAEPPVTNPHSQLRNIFLGTLVSGPRGMIILLASSTSKTPRQLLDFFTLTTTIGPVCKYVQHARTLEPVLRQQCASNGIAFL